MVYGIFGGEKMSVQHNMDVQTLANVYLALVIASAIISLIIGVVFTKKLNHAKKGLLAMAVSSFVLLLAVMEWFGSASSKSYMGTIPLVFNIAATIVIYAIYLLVCWLVFKRIVKKSTSAN